MTSNERLHTVYPGARYGRIEDLRGKTFVCLRVIGRARRKGARGLFWVCQCECGRHVYATSSSLRDGSTWHCGCLSDQTRDNVITDIASVRFVNLIPVPGQPGMVELDARDISPHKGGRAPRRDARPPSAKPVKTVPITGQASRAGAPLLANNVNAANSNSTTTLPSTTTPVDTLSKEEPLSTLTLQQAIEQLEAVAKMMGASVTVTVTWQGGTS